MLSRRPLLLAPALLSMRSAHALPARRLEFPRDHGAHPLFRTEWWYLTGWANVGTAQQERLIGFQITFFRSRIDAAQPIRSALAAKQLIFAHAAVTDVNAQTHLHDQRSARAGFGIAQASESTTDVKLRAWHLRRHEDGSYSSNITARDFQLELRCEPTQPILLQGQDGLSRKGPQAKNASYYYSQPHLRAQGPIRIGTQTLRIASGSAWLDHEWSEEIMHPEAVGWDWIGMNLFDGSSLMAFQLRQQDGAPLWAEGVFRTGARHDWQRFAASTRLSSSGELISEIAFSPQKFWRSPHSGARYPIEWLVRTPADIYTVRALAPAQEMDSRSSTGTIYWEGLSDLIDSNGRLVGRGYLEMTGYANRLRV